MNEYRRKMAVVARSTIVYSTLLHRNAEILRTDWAVYPEIKASLLELIKSADRLNASAKKWLLSMDARQKTNAMQVIIDDMESKKVDMIDTIQQKAWRMTEDDLKDILNWHNDTPIHICDIEQGAANNGESGKGGV